jgi:hypothetical protein
MVKTLKLILALLLLICLADMPYGYYQFVRLVSCIVFAYFAFQESTHKSKLLFIYGGLALLFQPFIKISLGRVLWNIVDVIVAIGLLISLFRKKEA